MRVAQGWTEAAEPAGRFEKLSPGSQPTAKASVIPTTAALQIQPNKKRKKKNRSPGDQAGFLPHISQVKIFVEFLKYFA